ncbi:MAG: restriction endonuclease subunit S [Ghiorsea sp.]|nr:restriction endonuclease subunit S [Ghiorsea sp.]
MTLKGEFSKLELMQGRVGFIPSGWKFMHLNKAFNIKNTFRKPINEGERNENPGSHPYYGPTKIQGYIASYEQDGDYVLIGEDGDHFLKYRTQSMTQLVSGKCTVNNHAHIIEGTEEATKEWFYYYFMHRDIFSFLSRQGAGRYKLNKAALEKLPVLIPPLPEQKKIAQILSTWDKAIETVEKLIANSQQKKKALMQQLLTGKKRFPEFDGEWKEVRLVDVLNDKKRKGKIVPTNENQSGMAYIGSTSFKGNFEIYTDSSDAVTCLPNDILVLWDGENAGKVTTGLKGAVSSTVVRYCINQTKADSLFLTYNLLRDNYKVRAIREGSGIPHMPGDFEQWYHIALPALEEQKRITSILSSTDQEIETWQQELTHLKQEKKALMQQLLTGKRRVKLSKQENHHANLL